MITFKDFIEENEPVDENLKDHVIKLFETEKHVSNMEINTLSIEHGYSIIEINQMIYRLLNSFFYYGNYQDKVRTDANFSIDKDALRKGIKEEYEHTNDKSLAEKIAKDHLTITPEYYTLLKKLVEPPEENNA